MPASSVRGRFDDLRSGTCHHFAQTAFELVATRPDEVVPVLTQIERITDGGGWAFGFVSYEAAASLDGDLAVHEPMPGLPLAWFGVTTAPASGPALRRPRLSYRTRGWSLAWSFERYLERMEAVRERIARGDTYQCNLTTKMSGEVIGDSFAFYTDLVLGQGGAYNTYLDLGRFVVASASPELFFEIEDDLIRMRPMKGTIRRGVTAAEDEALLAQLRSSAKERAENIMIVDLVRNDLARIAAQGSVRVDSLCRVETYDTVHQLTSDVTARLHPRTDLVDVFRALFPCGSVTGVPKCRTMALIRELESGPRGVYCGAVGWVAPRSEPIRARFNVAIRTALLDTVSGITTYGTGGGITWDSDPVEEFAELKTKTAVLTRCRGSRPH
jgi:para-aminobenzoate synthetase/4-amino-4-deoxychorismate lyase